MGTHTYGSLDVEFSRELTDAEYGAWFVRCKHGRTTAPLCANPKHDRAPMVKVAERTAEASGVAVIETGEDWRCRHYRETETGGYCFVDHDRYDPHGWVFDDSSWGDVGIAHLARNGFTIESGGKVYDITDAAAWFVEALPFDITASGTGAFESDSQHWGLRVEGRQVHEVSAGVVVQGEAAPVGCQVWMLGHVNFADGSVAVRTYADENVARRAFSEESEEHAATGVFSHREDAPWIAHFVTDGECLTWLDRDVIA